jgi:hypothetical protein
MKFETRPLEETPLERGKPVSGAWKNEGGRPDYEIVEISDILEAQRRSIKEFINELIKRKEGTK